MTHAATTNQPSTDRLRQVESYQVRGSKVELFVSRREHSTAETCDMDVAITQAADLLTDMDNEEYIRGMCELMARMFPAHDTCTHERAEWFTAQVEKKLRACNAAPSHAMTQVAMTSAAFTESDQRALPAGYIHLDTGRTAVLARDYAHSDLNGDASAYWYNKSAESMGLDPWRLVEGVDLHTQDDGMDVVFANGSTKPVGADATIFLSFANAQKLNGQATTAVLAADSQADGHQPQIEGYLVKGEQTQLWVSGQKKPTFTVINGHDPVVSITAMKKA